MFCAPLALLAAAALSLQGAVAGPCGNSGLQWAFFNNTSGYNDIGSNYSTFDPTVYQHATPVYTATTSRVGGNFFTASGDLISIYGSPGNLSPSYYVLNHQGYMHIKNTGKYTFVSSNVDDILLVWVGKTATSGWTRDNANCVSINNGKTAGKCTFTAPFSKGQYVPIRIMYGQSLYTSTFSFAVSNPSGLKILDGAHASKNVMQFGCGKALQKAPKLSFGPG